MKKLNKDIWIKDPIHGFLELDSKVDDIFFQLIDSAFVQRLRRIRQLGTSSFIYPGAEHSRFTHSIGTYQTAKKSLDHFRSHGWLNDSDYRNEIEIPVLVAALLHDVGHLPFSHSFEPILNVSHEQITMAIVEDNTEVRKILRSFDSTLAQKVISLFQHNFFLPVGNAIISSQLDADRLDYICRDSYMTGANYGFLDINRIISVLTVVDNQMAVLEKGLGTIEEYLIARFYMYWEVYFHKTSRGMNLLLEKIFQRKKDLNKEKSLFGKSKIQVQEKRYQFLFQDLRTESIAGILEDFMLTDDTDIFYLLKIFSTSSDAILNDLSSRFLARRLLKPVAIKSEKEKENLKDIVVESGFDSDYYFLEDSSEKRIYLPNPIESENSDGIKIWDHGEKKLREISDFSIIIGKLGKISYRHKKYVFVPGIVRDRFFELQ